jgi:tRNA-binding protein
MKPPIEFADFEKIHFAMGTIVHAEMNEKAKKPAYILHVDFGDYGIKTSSAQLTANYSIADLIGKQIVGVLNFPVKSIAGVKSEVLILGALSAEKGVVLLQPSLTVESGSSIG